MIREVDGLIANDYPYVLHWYPPYTAILYWNKFGTPQGHFSRTGDYFGSGSGAGIPQMWWIDPEKEAKLEQARRDSSIKLEVGPEDDRYWLEYGQKEAQVRPGN
jgi:hypothetical protein